MAKFYMGQPVKVVRDNTGLNPELVGIEATVISVEGWYEVNDSADWFGPPQLHYGYQLSSPSLPYYDYIVCTEDELEPIIPEGLESPEQIEELYEPEATEEDIYVLSRP